MKMDGFDIVGVFLGTVAGMPHIADDIACRDGTALLKAGEIRVILP